MMELIKELTEVKQKIEKNVEKGRVRDGYLAGFMAAGKIVLKHYRLSQDSKELRNETK